MNPQITMRTYFVNKACFERNEKFRPQPDVPVKMIPEFKRTVFKVSETQAIVRLEVELADRGEPVPFTLSAAVSGIFDMNDWDTSPMLRKLLADMAATTLYPYLRALVSTVTANGSVPPYNLPIINIVGVFNNEMKAVATDATLQ